MTAVLPENLLPVQTGASSGELAEMPETAVLGPDEVFRTHRSGQKRTESSAGTPNRLYYSRLVAFSTRCGVCTENGPQNNDTLLGVLGCVGAGRTNQRAPLRGAPVLYCEEREFGWTRRHLLRGWLLS